MSFSAAARRRLRSRGSQMDLAYSLKMGSPFLHLRSLDRTLSLWVQKHARWSLPLWVRARSCNYLSSRRLILFAYQRTAFGSLALPALAKIRGGDARDLCLVCFGAEHAQSALAVAGWVYSVNVPNRDTYKLLAKCLTTGPADCMLW